MNETNEVGIHDCFANSASSLTFYTIALGGEQRVEKKRQITCSSNSKHNKIYNDCVLLLFKKCIKIMPKLVCTSKQVFKVMSGKVTILNNAILNTVVRATALFNPIVIRGIFWDQ